jgi:hypothetical protein
MITRKNAGRSISAAMAFGLIATALAGCSAGPATPEETIKSYLEAVAAGDAEKALELVNPGVSDNERQLLTDAVLKESGEIKNIKVLPAEDDDDVPVDTSSDTPTTNSVNIEASYEIGGEPVSLYFDAERTTESWTVTGGYDTLSLPFSPYVTELSVNGTPVNGDETTEPPVVFPGVYKVELPENEIVSMEPMEIVTSGTASESPEFEVNGGVVDEFDEFLTGFVDTCYAATREVRDEHCPNWAYLFDDEISDLKWELLSLPEVEIAYESGLMTISQTKPIAQRLTYAHVRDSFWDDGPQAASMDKSEDMVFDVSVDGGDLTFSVESSRSWGGMFGEPDLSKFY